MNSKDWLLRAFANDEIPKEVEVMWEPLKWSAANMDTIYKIMGKTVCDQNERNKIIKFLFDEQRYELFLAMLLADRYDSASKDEKSGRQQDFTLQHSENEVFQMLAQGQLLSFLKWCDRKDYKDIFEGKSAIDLYRLIYIALSIGYKKLALHLILSMEEQYLTEGAAAMDRYKSKSKVLLKKWVVEFYRKQPESRSKKKLAKRLIRYHAPLFTT